MTTAQRFVEQALTHLGEDYVYGAGGGAAGTDCSELVKDSAAECGVTVPDGSWVQFRHCVRHNTDVSVHTGVETVGALLFRFSSDPLHGDRPSSAHVAISRGDGTTVEARGTRWGVVVASASGRGWTHAGLVPGVDYTEADMAQFTDQEAKILRQLVDAVKARDSNGGFAGFAIDLIRKEREYPLHTPGGDAVGAVESAVWKLVRQ